jgi:hypothetical protein
VSTAVLDPCAGELAAERLWALPSDPEADARGAEASLDQWITTLLRDLTCGGAVACLACGDPSGLRAATDGGPAACCNCGSTLS